MLLPSPGGAGPQGPASTLSRVQGPRAPGGVEGPKALVGSGAKPRSRRLLGAAPKAPPSSPPYFGAHPPGAPWGGRSRGALPPAPSPPPEGVERVPLSLLTNKRT